MAKNTPLTESTLKKSYKAYLAASQNATVAASALGITRSSLQHRLNLAVSRGLVSVKDLKPKPEETPLKDLVALRAKRVERADDLKAYQALQHEKDEVQKRLDVALALQGAPKAGRYEIPTYKPHGSQAIPILVLSDLHLEEKVDPRQVPGANNEFNLEIGVKRLEKVFQHGLYMTETMRHMAKIDTLCLALLGDMMSGHIHEDLAESNNLSPVETVLHIQEHLGAGIEYLLSKGDFKQILIPCCHGNHARTGEKMRVQTSAENSYEWMLYNIMRREWKHEKRLQWHIADGYHQYLKLHDTVVRFHHGDAVNYGGGIGGITIPMRKAISNWNTVQRADLSINGHFHQFMDGGDFLSNGSLIGYNAFALRIKAAFEPPKQAFCLIDHKRGKTLSAEVFVD